MKISGTKTKPKTKTNQSYNICEDSPIPRRSGHVPGPTNRSASAESVTKTRARFYITLEYFSAPFHWYFAHLPGESLHNIRDNRAQQTIKHEFINFLRASLELKRMQRFVSTQGIRIRWHIATRKPGKARKLAEKISNSPYGVRVRWSKPVKMEAIVSEMLRQCALLE